MSYIFNNRQNANLQMSKMESDGRNGKQKAAEQSRRVRILDGDNPSLPESSAFICRCIDVSTYVPLDTEHGQHLKLVAGNDLNIYGYNKQGLKDLSEKVEVYADIENNSEVRT